MKVSRKVELPRGYTRRWFRAGGAHLGDQRYAKLMKKALRIPVICVGGFVHREAMERAIADGECDMVAVARALIADPFLYRHMQEGVHGPTCDFCNACYSHAAVWPVDCYNDRGRPEKDRMLEAGGRLMSGTSCGPVLSVNGSNGDLE